jgi:AcrR family transcriptional regulator
MARPRSDIRLRVVHAARAEFLARGVDASTLRAIGRRARTSIGMIYYYFPTKEDLFLAVIEEVYARFLEDLVAAVAAHEDARGRLRALIGRVATVDRDEREVVFLVVREVLTHPARRARIVERFLRGHVAVILGVIADGQRRGELDAAVPPGLALAVTGAVGAFPQLVAHAAGPAIGLQPGPALADLLIDILFRALGPRSEPDAGSSAPVAAPAPTKRSLTKER